MGNMESTYIKFMFALAVLLFSIRGQSSDQLFHERVVTPNYIFKQIINTYREPLRIFSENSTFSVRSFNSRPFKFLGESFKLCPEKSGFVEARSQSGQYEISEFTISCASESIRFIIKRRLRKGSIQPMNLNDWLSVDWPRPMDYDEFIFEIPQYAVHFAYQKSADGFELNFQNNYYSEKQWRGYWKQRQERWNAQMIRVYDLGGRQLEQPQSFRLTVVVKSIETGKGNFDTHYYFDGAEVPELSLDSSLLAFVPSILKILPDLGIKF